MTEQECADYLKRMMKQVSELTTIVASMSVGLLEASKNENEGYKVTISEKAKGKK